MYKILVSDKLGQAGLDLLSEFDDVTYDEITGMSQDELIAVIPDYDALIIRSRTKPNAEVIAAGARLKVIGRAGAGVDNVDVEAATKKGIMVMNTPGANSVAAAEQTIALMLAVCRNTVLAHNSLAAGEWNQAQFIGSELAGKTLGIIGFGYIGRLVARRAKAFEMKVIAYSPSMPVGAANEVGARLMDLPDLLAEADIITLHSTVTPENTNMINASTIAQMKDGVVLVNVARGKLIDEQALAKALYNRKVSAAALDVYQQEPPLGSPLIGLPNVLHTPHLGASSKEAQYRTAVEIVQQVVDALRGTDFRNVINPMPASTQISDSQIL